MDIFKHTDTLISQVRSVSPRGVIAVDGFDRVGKTTLADKLAKALGSVSVSIDKYMWAGHGHYIDRLRYNGIKDAIQNALKGHGSVVVEGICMSSVLQKVGIAPATTIYVKGIIGDDARWIHERLLIEGADPEVLLDASINARPLGGVYLNYLHLELVPYHLSEQPHVRSTVTLENDLSRFFG